MTDLDRSIANLGDKIDELAVQISALRDNVREFRQVNQRQSEQISQLIVLAQQQQTAVDRLLAKN